jgi:serine/threonine protein kinase
MIDWNPRANDLFLRAAAIETPAQRQQFLDEHCGTDAALRRQVEELLSAGEKIGSFLNRPAALESTGNDEPAAVPLTEGPGTVIGPYKLLQQLGEGGFGVVFLAEQQEPVRRQVALKIIKPGLDSKPVLARFEQERQALALMDHPSIARVLDGGTTESGRPYFVMELVKGVPITTFCDQNRLSPRERLELFVQVCQAVQHAHQKGIIHRDLKPSNVLVTLYDDKPVPKVIDFGVAKAIQQKLTEKTLFTGVGQVVGTLEYMSPEQATLNALDVDTRSDVYALGVLLYELLTGTTPLGKEQLLGVAFLEILRLIREVEPPRPSTRLSGLGGGLSLMAAYRKTDPHRLPKLLAGELDWIALKALDKDRSRRYATATALASDVQRYLKDEPVEARAPSAWYRFRKLARRNRASVTAAALVTAALVVGIVATTWQAVRATDAEETTKSALGKLQQEQPKTVAALQEARRAGQLALQSVRVLTNAVIKEQMARQVQITEQDRAYLREVLHHLEELVLIRGDDPESRAVRAEGYQHVAEIQAFLGENKGARSAYERAIDLYTQLVTDFGGEANHSYYLALSREHLGRLLTNTRKYEEAANQHRQALDLFKRLADGFLTEPKYRHELANSHDGLGNALGKMGKVEPAETELRQALKIKKQLVADFPKWRPGRESQANSHNNLALVLRGQRKYWEAVEELRAAIDLREKLLADFPNEVQLREDLANHHNNLGGVLDDLGDRKQAEAEYRKALKIRKQLAAQFPAVPRYRYKLGSSHHALGYLLMNCGRPEEAKPEYDQSLPLLKQLAAESSDNSEYQLSLGGLYCDTGAVVRKIGVAADGLPWYEQAIRTLAPLVKREPGLARARTFLRNSHISRATLLMELGRFPEAQPDWDRALELTGQLDQKALCNMYWDRASALMKWDRFADAIKDWDLALKHDNGSLGAEIRIMRALCLARVNPAKALAETETLLQAGSLPPPVIYYAAWVYALCSAKAEDAAARKAYADRAVALLQQAREQGCFKNPVFATHMKTLPDLEPLRARADFRKLLAELEASKK